MKTLLVLAFILISVYALDCNTYRPKVSANDDYDSTKPMGEARVRIMIKEQCYALKSKNCPANCGLLQYNTSNSCKFIEQQVGRTWNITGNCVCYFKC